MKISIVCEDCQEKHHLERTEFEPGPINIICHNCEQPLQAILDAPPPMNPAARQELASVGAPQRVPSGFAYLADPPSTDPIVIHSERSHA